MSDDATPYGRFLNAAQLCRRRDLERLSVLGEVVSALSELIHALQRERGASSIVLGSSGLKFQERLASLVSHSREHELAVLARLAPLEQQLDGMSFGSRFYVRGAMAFRALDRLPALRSRILSLQIEPQEAQGVFSAVIGCLLAVGFEVSDIAADPQISRALIAQANFAQGKEYAGQERATAGAGLSGGQVPPVDQQRLRQLIGAQDQAFRVFGEFAAPGHLQAYRTLQQSADTVEVRRLRRLALAREGLKGVPSELADAWFRHSTARIDSMKLVEEGMTQDLNRLCAIKLSEARTGPEQSTEHAVASPQTAPVAMLVPTDVLSGGVGLYTLDGALPQPMRSILEVVHAQSRQLDDVSHQLETARAALIERKAIERAKGLLMANRNLTEKQAYQLLREAAMSQNKHIGEIAQTILSMAEIL
jgi:hypothetical protein